MKTATGTWRAAVAIVIAACSHESLGPSTGGGTAGLPAVAAKLAFTIQPANAMAGVVLSPAVAVTIEDSLGRPVAGATNAVSVAIDTGLSGLSGTTTVTAVNAVASFEDLSIQRAGGYTLTASSGTLARATSGSFTVTAAAPAELFFIQQPTNTWPAQPIVPAVRVAVADAFGNAVPTGTNAITLAIATNPGRGTLAGATTANTVSGVATFPNLTIDRPGVGYTLAATALGLLGVTSAKFAIHVPFAQVSAGGDHACGVTPVGAAYCWGAGHGGSPAATAGGLAFGAVSAGGQHTCGVSPAGVAYCWGINTYGQLGTGDTVNSPTPIAVAGGLTFSALSAGGGHTCGVSPGGVAYCWGTNASGQLGTGDTVSSATPVAVAGGLTFAAVSAGGQHTCGVSPAGVVYCWGSDRYGQLGDGDTVSSATPAAVPALSFAAVSAGGQHTCGLTGGGAVYCWGSNGSGELGNGTRTNSATPVAVSGGLTFVAASAGGAHTCAVTSAHAAVCWGRNASGELGDGAFSFFVPRTTPVGVSGGLRFAGVSTGSNYTCGVSTVGATYCWGLNTLGQLGAVSGQNCAVNLWGKPTAPIPCSVIPVPLLDPATTEPGLGSHDPGLRVVAPPAAAGWVLAAPRDGANPPPQTVSVTGGGGGITVGTISSGCLRASLDGSVTPATLTVNATTGTLAPGTYAASVERAP